MFVFALRGSVFPKACVWAGPCTLFSMVLHTVLKGNQGIADSLGVGDAAAGVFGGFTFILGFLVVFRSQQAYSRWWEGGTLLQQLRGEWFNSFSCLLAFCNAAEEKRVDVQRFQHQLVRLFSLLYGCALTQVSTLDKKQFQLIALDGLGHESLEFLQSCPDKCEIVLQWIQRLIVESEQSAVLKIAPPILSRVYNELGNGIVNLNNARKIKEFPIPFPLAQMIMVMLFFHAIITPFICAATVETTGWAGVITFVVTFSYWSILYIALELEMPFGDDLNDLPLLDMALDMNNSLAKMLSKKAQQVPTFDYFPETHDKLAFKIVDFDGDLVDYAHQRAFKSQHDSRIDLDKIVLDTKPAPDEDGHQAERPHGISTSTTCSATKISTLTARSTDVSGDMFSLTTVPEAEQALEQALPVVDSTSPHFRASRPRPPDGASYFDSTSETPPASFSKSYDEYSPGRTTLGSPLPGDEQRPDSAGFQQCSSHRQGVDNIPVASTLQQGQDRRLDAERRVYLEEHRGEALALHDL